MKTFVYLTAALAAFAVGSADAASLFVKPTTVICGRRMSAASVTPTNSGDAAVTAQLRLFAWDQTANEDKLTPTSAIAASPPMMTIKAGQSQTIRLVRTAPSAAAKEESYRLLVDEITDRKADPGAGVVIQLRYSVPIFVMPQPRDAANVTFKAEVDGDGLVLDATNVGKAHAQISNVSLSYADGSTQLVGAGLLGYVLPDKNRQWKLTLPAGSPGQRKPASVRAEVNGQELLVKL